MSSPTKAAFIFWTIAVAVASLFLWVEFIKMAVE